MNFPSTKVFRSKPNGTRLQGKFHVIPPIRFSSSLATVFVSHIARLTDRQTICKNCEIDLRTPQNVKNRKTKVLTIPVLSSYIEYRRK